MKPPTKLRGTLRFHPSEWSADRFESKRQPDWPDRPDMRRAIPWMALAAFVAVLATIYQASR